MLSLYTQGMVCRAAQPVTDVLMETAGKREWLLKVYVAGRKRPR